MPTPIRFLPAGLLLLASCAGAPSAAPAAADIAAAEAAIDSLLSISMEGASSVDADKVSSIAQGAPDFTFVTGDVIVSGLEATRESFRRTYASIRGQSQQVLEKKIRLLTPDVAVLMAASEGTYTDLGGVVSEPVGMGLTIVFVRRDGRWVAEHAHQSIIK
jgi:uncharacterized protein (TIGR02246 family)